MSTEDIALSSDPFSRLQCPMKLIIKKKNSDAIVLEFNKNNFRTAPGEPESELALMLLWIW